MSGIPIPSELAVPLQQLCDDLRAAAGGKLVGVFLYGGVARGRYKPGRSDVNMLVLLSDASPHFIQAISPVLHAAWRAIRVEPFVLEAGELARAAEIFPTKLLDIQLRHTVLWGDDPLPGMHIPADALRMRISQELQNLVLRLRRRFIAVHEDADALGAALVRAAVPLSVSLAALLHLHGKPVNASDGPRRIFRQAAAMFGLDEGTLNRLADLRQAPSDGATPAFFGQCLEVILAADHVGALRSAL